MGYLSPELASESWAVHLMTRRRAVRLRWSLGICMYPYPTAGQGRPKVLRGALPTAMIIRR
jgi:hypothetical protein